MRFAGELEALKRVFEICEVYGFGNVMTEVSREWRRYLARNGSPVGGEFIAGPCQGSLDMRNLRDAVHMLEEIDQLRARVAELEQKLRDGALTRREDYFEDIDG